MPNQTSSTPVIPPEWQPKYVIKRIEAEEIIVPQRTRDVILRALDKGLRFVQIGEYTLMLNAIRSIDPLWGPKNIPPRPEEQKEFQPGMEGKVVCRVTNADKLALWDRLFADKVAEKAIEEWVAK
jgi:hypothetical protein